MATIYREFTVEAGVDQVWDALRDFGAVHQRLAPGFVTDCRMEEGARVVTFVNGLVTAGPPQGDEKWSMPVWILRRQLLS